MRVKLYCHIWLLVFWFFIPNDTVPPTRNGVDTLREVEVRGDTVLPIQDAIKQSLKAHGGGIKVPSLGDVLERISPGINDKILHPFAVKERKRERKHKRDQKILRDFDRVRTFQDLLEEAVARQQLEDEAKKSKQLQSDK